MSTFSLRGLRRHPIRFLALWVFFSPLCLFAQQHPSSPTQEPPATHGAAGASNAWADDLKNYPGLADELTLLLGRLMRDVHFPDARHESRLLPLVPSSSIAYATFPNYGDAATQALAIFHQQLAQSAVLRDWWQHGSLAANGPQIEDALAKLAQLHSFLGPELVLSSAMQGNQPDVVVFAEIRKPGLQAFLQQCNQDLAAKHNSKFHFRLLQPQELATAQDQPSSDQLTVLLRSDFAVSADSLSTLRSFNALLDSSSRDFVSTPFAQRILGEYRDGITSLAALDIHRILESSYPVAKQSDSFRQSGFADTQYFLWDHKTVSSREISQMELSFTSPRHGAAAWIAPPSPLGSIDFVSPESLMVFSLMLASPSQIFDDLKSLSPDSKTYTAISGGEQALGLNVKDDLLNLLTGELTFEVDSLTPPQPVWRAFLGTRDAAHLAQTLATLARASQSRLDSVDKGDLAFYSLEIPNKENPTRLVYAFADGYLILGPSIDAVSDSIQLHRSGQSLAKSQKFLATIPPGQTSASSGLFYEDPGYLAKLRLSSLLPQLSGSLREAAATGDLPSLAGHFYGEPSAIREVSTNAAFDAAGVLIVAAIAIPNLLRSRIAANESSAVGSLRTINTAQASYAAAYPHRGFAPTLLSLGPDDQHPATTSPDHADLISDALAGPACSTDGWCPKSGYRFRIDSLCAAQKCSDYVVLATPISTSSGTRSFCSASDAILRFHSGDPINAPLSIAECKSWSPL